MGVMVLLSSCLDEDPKYTQNALNVYSNDSTAQLALTSIYGQLASQGTFAQLIAEVNSDASGIVWATYNPSNNPCQYIAGAIPVANEFNDLMWDGLYRSVSSCNSFIAEASGSSLANRDNMVAQAKFLRGVCYYYLMTFYGGVPLRLEPTTSNTIHMPRATRQQVLDQVIKDWTDARAYLTDDIKQEKGAPTAPCKSTVDAYLAKLYWTLGCNTWAYEQGDPWATDLLVKEWPEVQQKSSQQWFEMAKTEGEKVLQSGKFDLENSLKTLFGGNRVTYSKELIFQIDATMNTSNNVAYNSLHWTFSPANTSQGISWSRNQPKKWWYDYCRGTYRDDPRLKIFFNSYYEKFVNYEPSGDYSSCYPLVVQEVITDTIGWEYTYGRGGKIVDSTAIVTKESQIVDLDYSTFRDPTNPELDELSEEFKAQYCDISTAGDYVQDRWPMFWKHYTNNCSGRYADNNLYVYRYADFLLLMADVYNELGDQNTALSLANKVLNRARHSEKTDASTESEYPKDWTACTKDEFRQKVYRERLFELCAEFDGFNDTRRWGMNYFKPLLEANQNHNITKASYESRKNAGYGGQCREYWYPNALGGYNEGGEWTEFLKKNMLIPIPRNESDANEMIDGIKDQNYGY